MAALRSDGEPREKNHINQNRNHIEIKRDIRIRPPFLATGRNVLLFRRPIDPPSGVPLFRKYRVTLIRDNLELGPRLGSFDRVLFLVLLVRFEQLYKI